jgi:hypothetical protein
VLYRLRLSQGRALAAKRAAGNARYEAAPGNSTNVCGNDVELNLSSRDASRFALDLSQAAAAAVQTNDLTRSEREQGYETVVALKVALANYGMDKRFENIFLNFARKTALNFVFRWI